MVAFLAEVPGGDMPTYNTNIAVIRMREISLEELRQKGFKKSCKGASVPSQGVQ